MTRRRVGPSLGVPTLMVTFVALSMAVFATLSLLSARLDYNLARRQAEASRPSMPPTPPPRSDWATFTGR